MRVKAEVGIYPLRQHGLTRPIKQFVNGLKRNKLQVKVGPMSSLVAGDSHDICESLRENFEQLAKEYEIVLTAQILKHRDHLWTFVYDPCVEPTNNRAERVVRQGVLWRKGSFGTQSERGARYVECILTACATCRLQGQSVIEYLRNACRCHLSGDSVPSLVKTTGNQIQTA